MPAKHTSTVKALVQTPHGRKVVSLDRKCLGASPRSQTLLPQLLPRSIFDKETRRKAVAVAGAAMELAGRMGPRKSGKEARWPGRDKAGRAKHLSGPSDFVNRMQAGIGHGSQLRSEDTSVRRGAGTSW